MIAQVLKEKWFLLISQTTNKLVNEAANDSTPCSRQDRKKPPALRTNQIVGFEEFRLLVN